MAYFNDVYPIWSEYQKGKISLSKRDKLLAPYRAELHAVPKGDRPDPPPALSAKELIKLSRRGY